MLSSPDSDSCRPIEATAAAVKYGTLSDAENTKDDVQVITAQDELRPARVSRAHIRRPVRGGGLRGGSTRVRSRNRRLYIFLIKRGVTMRQSNTAVLYLVNVVHLAFKLRHFSAFARYLVPDIGHLNGDW
jgi:hypothetical protein